MTPVLDGVTRRLADRWFLPALVAVLALQALADLFLLHRSYFIAEDFTFLQLFRDTRLDLDALTRPIFGHLIPGFIVVNKYFGIWFGASWLPAALVTLVVQLGATIAFTRLIFALKGRVWWLPLISAAFALSLVNTNTAQWWGATMTIHIALAACIGTVGSVIRFATRRRWQHLVSVAACYALALSFWEKSLVTCVYIGLFVLLVGVTTHSGSWADRIREAIRLWPAWLIMIVLSILDVVVYVNGEFLSASGASPRLADVFKYVGLSYTHGLFPSLLGINFPRILGGLGLTAPIVATIFWLLVIGWTCLRSSLARRAWLWFFVVNFVSQMLIARGRVGISGPMAVAEEFRYLLDATYLFLIAFAVALPAALAQQSIVVRRAARLAVIIGCILVLPMWLVSFNSLKDNTPGPASRVYFAKLRADGIPKGSHLLSAPAPAWLVPPNMYPWNMGGRIYPFVKPGTRVDDSLDDKAVMIRHDGTIGPVSIVDANLPGTETNTGCLTPGRKLTVARVESTPPNRSVIVRIRYHATSKVVVSFKQKGGEKDVPFLDRQLKRWPAGSGERVASSWPLPWDQVELQLVSGTGFCVDAVGLSVTTE